MPRIPLWIFLLLSALLLSAAWIDIMDIDAAQYAEISRELLHRSDWLSLYDEGYDYLDKPPLLFWLSALSMKLFGAGNFGYKFPSIVFAIWSMYPTYRLAENLYKNENTARFAALVLGSCQGLFLMTNDVRTDTILTGCVVTAIWCMQELTAGFRWRYVLGAGLGLGGGLLAKGPIALIVPASCFIADWTGRREWKKFFQGWMVPVLGIAAAMLVPMCIGLYRQFDLHPEKLIDGKYGTSGLRFYFWTQSFGRITGENAWENGAGFEFLLVNMLWSFLPWIFLFLPALALDCTAAIRQKLRIRPGQEALATGGFVLTYIALALSHYQLPHYIFVAFPLAALTTAKWTARLLEGAYPKLRRFLQAWMTGVGALLLLTVLAILVFTFPAGPLLFAAWGASAILFIYLAWKKRPALIWAPLCAILLTNVFLTHYFYRTLLTYQVGNAVGCYIRSRDIPEFRVLSYKTYDPLTALHFYSGRVIPIIKDTVPIVTFPGLHLLTESRGIAFLTARRLSFDTLLQGDFFKVSELTPEFLNARTRPAAVRHYYLLRLN